MAFFLVTGGCGFIGSHLVDALVREGHRVRILDDLSTPHPVDPPAAVALTVGDVQDPDTVARALEGVDGCFHLAAVVSVTRCEEQWRDGHEINLTSTLNLLRQATLREKPIPVVFASSAAVYGAVLELPVREEIVVRPTNAYGADKAACELHAAALGRKTGASLTGLRFFNVYGPRQDPSSVYAGVVSIFCKRLMKGEPVDIYGDGGQTRDFIHVYDVARALLGAMKSAPSGAQVFNICTGKAISIASLAETIAELCGTRLQMSFHPVRDGDIRHSVGDPSRAAAALNFRARTPLNGGLSELVSILGGSAKSAARPVEMPAR